MSPVSEHSSACICCACSYVRTSHACSSPVYPACAYVCCPGICISVNAREITNRQVHLHSTTSRGKNTETAQGLQHQGRKALSLLTSGTPCTQVHSLRYAYLSWGWDRALSRWGLKCKLTRQHPQHMGTPAQWGQMRFIFPYVPTGPCTQGTMTVLFTAGSLQPAHCLAQSSK